MSTLTPNYGLIVPEGTDTLAQVKADYATNLGKIDNIGGGGSGGHTIVDENGSDMPAEGKLQFTGNVQVTDDNVNGKTVVDIIGGGGNNLILDAQIYSDTEKVVGVWRDNKPLYQKTVNFGSLPANNGSKNVAHGINDIETLVDAVFVVQSSTQFRTLPNVSRGNVSNQTMWYMTATDIYVLTGNNADVGSAFSGYITLQYTKTTDVAGSGGYEAYGFTPIIYSDVERKVGVWRNNKPLYQKTIDLGQPVNNGTKTVAHNITDIDLSGIAKAEGIIYNANSNYSMPLPRVHDGSTNNQIFYEITATSIVIYSRNLANASNFTGRLTIQYTKTTDVAGSGDYNTIGIPTVHYSTSEQVIGTWIDSKPLYEKTVPFTASSGGYRNVATGITDFDTIFVQEAFIKYSNGVAVLSSYKPSVDANEFVGLIGSSGSFDYRCGTNLNSGDGIVTLRYTKTTD